MSRVIERARPGSRPSLRRAGRFLWETLWTPFWLGSTLPPPALPGRREIAAPAGERTPLILRQLDDLRATIWRQRLDILVFRTLWLALLAIDVWLVFRVLADRALPLGPFAIVALLTLALGGVLIALARPSRGQLARTLDRSFGLRERIATALEETQGVGRLGGVRALQVLDATRVTRDVGKASAFRRRLPIREIALALVTATLCIVLLIMLIVQRGANPGGPNGALPGPNAGGQSRGTQAGGTDPNNPNNPNGQNGQQGQQGPGNTPGQQGSGQQGQPSAQGQRDLDTLAGALGDNAATREAADRLKNGDAAGAAQALRDAGANASQLSPDARGDLAGDLRAAAGQVSDPQLAQDLRDLAGRLTQPGASGAPGAADQVAKDIERIANGDQAGQAPGQNGQAGSQGQQGPNGGQGQGSGSGSGSGASPQLPGQQRQTPPQQGQAAPLLGADGKPVELPKGANNGPQINTQNPNNRGNGQTDPGAAGAGGGQVKQGEVGDAGVDTNQVPFEQRGAIERYFTPRTSNPDNNGE